MIDGKPTTVTAFEQGQRESRIRHALDHFLHRMKKHIGVYPLQQSDVLPDHDVVWMVGVDHGPGEEIANAMKRFPALWLGSLPENVCVVPCSHLKQAVGEIMADYLSTIGQVMVENQAAALEHEEREAQWRNGEDV